MQYLEAVARRKKRIPLQHITGEQEFMGLTFQETFGACAKAGYRDSAEEALKTAVPGMRILDMCTGSGCILISMVQFMKDKGILPGACTGTDISGEALLLQKRMQTAMDWILHSYRGICLKMLREPMI